MPPGTAATGLGGAEGAAAAVGTTPGAPFRLPSIPELVTKFTPASVLARAASQAGARIGARGTAGSRALGLAVEGAIEGAGFTAGQTLASQMLSDDPLDLEALSVATWKGALTGGVLGGAFGGFREMTRGLKALRPETVRPASKGIGSTLRSVDGDAQKALEDLDGVAADLRKRAAAGPAGEGAEAQAAFRAAVSAANGLRPARAAFQKARDALRKDLGDNLEIDFEKMQKLTPEQFSGVAQRLDDYQQAVKRIDELAGTTHANRLFDAGASGADDSLQALGGLGAVELADVAGFDLDKIPGVGGIAELALKGYFLARFLSRGAARRVMNKAVEQEGLGRQIVARVMGRAENQVAGRAIARMLRGPQAGLMGALGAIGNMRGQMSKAAEAVVKPLAAVKPGRAVIPAATTVLANTQLAPKKDKDPNPVIARMNELRSIAGNADLRRQLVETAASPVVVANPDIGFRVQADLDARIDFLVSKLPALKLSVVGSRLPPPPEVVDQFAAAVRVAEGGPQVLLDDMRTGYASNAVRDAVRELHPAWFAQMQEDVFLAASQQPDGGNYRTRLLYSRIFDVKLDPSLEPTGMAIRQTLYQPSEEAPQPPSRTSQITPTSGPTKGQQLQER